MTEADERIQAAMPATWAAEPSSILEVAGVGVLGPALRWHVVFHRILEEGEGFAAMTRTIDVDAMGGSLEDLLVTARQLEAIEAAVRLPTGVALQIETDVS